MISSQKIHWIIVQPPTVATFQEMVVVGTTTVVVEEMAVAGSSCHGLPMMTIVLIKLTIIMYMGMIIWINTKIY